MQQDVVQPVQRSQERFMPALAAWRVYALAVLSVGAAGLLRWAIDPLLGRESPFILFYPAIMLSGWFGGLGPGLLATALGAAAGMIWFVHPPGLSITSASQLALVLLIGIFISSVCEALHRAVRRARENAADLRDHERTAREAAEMLRLLIENVMDYSILLLDAQGRVVRWNDGARRLTGYDADEVIGRPVTMLFSPEDQAAGVPQQELREAERLSTVHHDRWYIRKDGSRYWATGTVTALHDEAGRIRGFVELRRDLTDRRLVEESLQASEDRLRMTTDVVPAIICYLDSNQRVRLLNRTYEDWYGRSRNDAYGKHISEVVGDAAYQKARAHIEQALSGRQVSFEITADINNGRRTLVVTYIPDIAQAQVRGLVAFANDIT